MKKISCIFCLLLMSLLFESKSTAFDQRDLGKKHFTIQLKDKKKKKKGYFNVFQTSKHLDDKYICIMRREFTYTMVLENNGDTPLHFEMKKYKAKDIETSTWIDITLDSHQKGTLPIQLPENTTPHSVQFRFKAKITRVNCTQNETPETKVSGKLTVFEKSVLLFPSNIQY